MSHTPTDGAGPLAGVRVLDLSEIIAAPFCSMLLADMGADVIKIEPPEGEPWRLQAPFLPAESKAFMSLNRGKRGLALNLKSADGQAILHALARDADVVVINYRPDVPAKLGISYEQLRAINPQIIYAQNTAFGTEGPYANRPGYDIILQAMSGLMAAAGSMNADGNPTTVGGTAVADFAAGLVLAWSICGALYAREKTGCGQKIDTSLFGAAMLVQTSRIFSVEAQEAETRAKTLETVRGLRQEGRPYKEMVDASLAARGMLGATQANAYYRVYQAADDYVAVGCLSHALRVKFCKAMGIEDPRLQPGRWQPGTDEAKQIGMHLVKQAEALFRSRPAAHWIEHLQQAGIPVGPVLFPEDLFDDAHVAEAGLMCEVEHSIAGPLRMVAPPLRMSVTPVQPRAASPALGEHTDAILRDLGYDSERIARLRAAGVVH